MARPNEVPCPLCDRGPFVDLVQHGAQYGGRAKDLTHLEMAAQILRDTQAAQSNVSAQLAQEVHDARNSDSGTDGPRP